MLSGSRCVFILRTPLDPPLDLQVRDLGGQTALERAGTIHFEQAVKLLTAVGARPGPGGR